MSGGWEKHAVFLWADWSFIKVSAVVALSRAPEDSEAELFSVCP